MINWVTGWRVRHKKVTLLSIAGVVWVCSLVLTTMSANAAPGPKAESINFWDDFEEDGVMNVNHAPWQSLLDKYVNDQHPSGINRFDYEGMSEVDLQRLTDYVNYLQKLEPRQLNKAEQMAFWINLYNAKTVELVAKAYSDGDEVSSIRQIRSGVFTPGPWERKSMEIVMQDVSLDDIEHGILRPHWNDRRIHYVLNCASIGCPNLLKTAFDGDNNEELLALAEQQFLSHSRAARIEDGELVLSSLFDWYSTDFADNEPALMAYLKANVDPQVAAQLDAASGPRFEYDWSLNKP